MRYTLRALILLSAALAFLAAVCFAFPTWLANGVMTMLVLIAAGVFAAGATVGPRRTRPFHVAALAALLTGVFGLGTPEEKLQKLRHFYAVLNYLYERSGQPHLVETNLYSTPVMNYFVEATLLLVCSLLAGWLCQAIAAMFWKDRGNEGTSGPQR
jgi:hypothetical protein